jgi:hypothetical protein
VIVVRAMKRSLSFSVQGTSICQPMFYLGKSTHAKATVPWGSWQTYWGQELQGHRTLWGELFWSS